MAGRKGSDGGAQFTVSLQVAPEETPQPTAASTTVPAGTRRGAILAIDDDEDILGVVHGFLDTLGFEVITTTDAESVLRVVAERSFDLVLCDIGMPKQNGLDLAQLLRNAGYRGKLVLMTGWDAHRVDTDQRSRAADLVLKKPFLGTELVSAIDQLLVS
jgi:two-component system CheB/CheR fusion protein